MSAHRPAPPAHVTLLNSCSSGGALSEDDADPLARLLNALASVADVAGLCATIQACLPNLIAHEWAALLLSLPELEVYCWQLDPPTSIEQVCVPAGIKPLFELTARLIGEDVRQAPEIVQVAARSCTALEGRYAVLPLSVADGSAVLCLGSGLVAAWREDEQRALTLASRSIQLSLQRMVANTRLQRMECNARLLDSIRAMIGHTLDLDSLLSQAVEQIALRYGYSLVSIYLLESDTLHCKHQVGYTNIIQRVPITTGIMARAVRQRQTIWVADVRGYPEFLAAMPGVMSEIAVPLYCEQTVYGVLNVESTHEQRLGPGDRALLESIAAELSVAIERIALYTATHRQAQQLAVIEQLRAAIASQLDIDALGATIVRMLRDQLHFEFVSLFLLQDDTLCLRSWCGDYQRLTSRIKLDQGLNGLCLRKQQPLLIKHIDDEPGYLGVAEGITSGIYVPLVYEHTILGTLSIESRATLSTSDFEIVVSLREQIAAALEQSRRIEAAQRARERESFLNKLLSAINQTQPDHWRDVWERLAVQLGALLEVDVCAIGLFEADQTLRLNIWQAQNHLSSEDRTQQVPLSALDPQVLEIFRHGRSFYLSDLTEYPETHSPFRRQLIAKGLVALAVVPVIVEGTLVALLGVSRYQRWRWEHEDIALLERVAQHLAVALRQANLRTQEAQRRHELELVYQTALDINAHHDLEAVLQAIVDRACALLDADCTSLYLLLPNGEEAELRVGVNLPPHLLGSRVRADEGLVGQTLKATRSYLVSDYSTWPLRDPNFNFSRLSAALGVPLIADNRVIGTLLTAHTRADKQFSPTDRRLIELLAAQAAQAIDTAQLLEDVRRRNVEMEAVYANAVTLSLDQDVWQILQQIVKRAHALIGSTSAGVSLLDPSTQELELIVGVNIPEELLHTRIKLGEGVLGRVAQTRQSIRLDNYQEWPDPADAYAGLPWLSVLGVPLLIGDQVLGTVGLALTDPAKRFTERDQRLLELFATQAAQAVDHARRFERERILRADAEGSLAEMQAVLQELEHTNEQVGRIDKLRLLGELASEVAHDFNNALASVLGNSQWLLLDETDPERVATLRAIEGAARDSAAMIKRLQEFGRMQHGPYTDLVDINVIVRDAVAMTQARWRELTQSKLQLDATHLIRGSASELRRVLMNLIVNAIDAMPDGGTLEIITQDAPDAVSVTVVDTGLGMPPEVQARVFDPFFTTKAAGMGTGLGLSICHQIIVRHGGTINVASTPGLGTTFTIYLPVGARGTRQSKNQEPGG
ncbi:MAG TPA: GAF domain-containing protein [Herpetosiphonaceae bacterium]